MFRPSLAQQINSTNACSLQREGQTDYRYVKPTSENRSLI